MKVLRSLVLMIAVAVFPGFLTQAYAQFEISPDHFEQPAATAAKAHSSHSAVASAHHHSKPVKMASKHSGSKAHHRQMRSAG